MEERAKGRKENQCHMAGRLCTALGVSAVTASLPRAPRLLFTWSVNSQWDFAFPSLWSAKCWMPCRSESLTASCSNSFLWVFVFFWGSTYCTLSACPLAVKRPVRSLVLAENISFGVSSVKGIWTFAEQQSSMVTLCSSKQPPCLLSSLV